MSRKATHSETKYVIVNTPRNEDNRMKEPDRDTRVLTDPLYPALNRSDHQTHDIMREQKGKYWYQASHQDTDRFRLVAYLSSSDEKTDTGGNRWKLFARQKDRNRAEFYMVPVDKNYDMKIAIKDDMIVGERLRDVYSVPKQLRFNSPLLNTSPYDVVELPMVDFSSRYV